MVNNKKLKSGEAGIPRRRGRPAGHNRVPLSQEERRARNAQYERERRQEAAEVTSELIEVVGCDPNISRADLLATVISRIRNATENTTDDLERINNNLEDQIVKLQQRLGLDDEAVNRICSDASDADTDGPPSSPDRTSKKQRKKRKHSD